MPIRSWHVHTPPVEAGYPGYWWLAAECGCIWRRGDEAGQWWMSTPIVLIGASCPWRSEGHPRSELDINEAMYVPCLQCPRDIGSRFRQIPHPLDPVRPPAPTPVPSAASRAGGAIKTTLTIAGGLVLSYFVFTACGAGGMPGWGP
jgi:hypothetical protein